MSDTKQMDMGGGPGGWVASEEVMRQPKFHWASDISDEEFPKDGGKISLKDL